MTVWEALGFSSSGDRGCCPHQERELGRRRVWQEIRASEHLTSSPVLGMCSGWCYSNSYCTFSRAPGFQCSACCHYKSSRWLGASAIHPSLPYTPGQIKYRSDHVSWFFLFRQLVTIYCTTRSGQLKDHVYGHLEFLEQAWCEIFWPVILKLPRNTGAPPARPSCSTADVRYRHCCRKQVNEYRCFFFFIEEFFF